MSPTVRRCCLGAATIAATVLAACGGNTTGATNVTQTTAKLNAVGYCDTNDEGRIYWEYRKVGASTWHRQFDGFDGRVLPEAGSKVNTDPCPSRIPASGMTALDETVDGLTPGSTYQYRIGFKSSTGEVFTDSDGGVNSDNAYNTFPTPACDDTQGATQTLQQFLDEPGNQNGTAGDPDLLCLRSGSQNLTGTPELRPHANQYIKGVAPTTLLGNIYIGEPNVTLEDFKIVGCHTTCPSGVFDVNKVIHIEANNVKVRYLDISQNGGLNNDTQNCVIVGSATVRTTGTEFVNNVSHDCGHDDDANHDHGIYCSNATGAKIVGNWFYRNEGFGIQVYPDCDNAIVDGNMVANNGWSITLAGEDEYTGWPKSEGVQFRYGAAGYSYQLDDGAAPIHCYDLGSGSATDMVLFEPDLPGVTSDCVPGDNGTLMQTNTLNASPVFENLNTNDLNVTGAAAKERTGLQYAENVPGPNYD